MQRITVRYEGRVQGVGFRYTAVRLAQELALTGWVRNEFDQSVSLVAEGEKDHLLSFLQAVRSSHLARHITAERVGRSRATGEFSCFSVRH